MSEEYICANCHETYPYAEDWTDEDAKKEYAEVFPDSTDEMEIVCDDCYKEMMITYPPERDVNYV